MTRRFNILASFVLLLAVAMQTGNCSEQTNQTARNRYLDSRSGSDQADGNKEHPWRSLERLSKFIFQPGDTIFFVAGSEFEGGFEVNQSGQSNAPITLKSFGKGSRPRFTNPRSAVLNGNAIRLNASHIVVDGLFFERCPSNPVVTEIHQLGAIFLTTNANDNIVKNCELTQTPVGITIYGERNLITRNFIHDNNAPIQPRWGPMGAVICGSHNEISYNRFENYSAPSEEFGHDGGAIEINDRSLPKEDIHIHHNLSLRNQGFIECVGSVLQNNFSIHHNVSMDYQSFLGLTGPCTNFRIEHNTVVRTLAHETVDSEDVVFWNYESFGANTNLNFRNNIFVYDGTRVEPVFARGQFDHSYNLFYRTDEASIPKQANRSAYERKYLGGGAHLGTGEKIGNPLFRDLANGDFRLQPGSPAIGSGINLGYAWNFDGQPIPTERASDIGAFQSVTNQALALPQ